MGRKKKFSERIMVLLPAGMLARIDAILGLTEDRAEMVRDVVEKEVVWRERLHKRTDREGNDGPL